MTTKPILDNREGDTSGGKAGAFLREAITPGAQVRAVSAYFSVDAYCKLEKELNAVDEFRFLFGAPASAAVKNPDDTDKPFIIGEDGDIALIDALGQQPAAKACEKWISKESVQVRTLKNGFLHGKMVIADTPSGGMGFCGSSNFTSHGLGFAPGGGNWELNIIADDKTRAALREWFENLWNDDNKVKDAKEEVLKELRQLGENKTPEFVYYLTLYRLFKEELEAVRQQESELHLEDSQIWNMLYRFQKDAVSGVIRRLERHRVCILADSVGLGKTFTALAVMKYYENKHRHILVLCPKRLEENWRQFAAHQKDNLLPEDRIRYDIHAHTDLGRRNDKTAWGSYDLVVIDESHYFRNSAGARYKELQEALQNAKAKVLMLSATPINTSLKDLRNQIRLGADDDAFALDINIPSVEQLAAAAQRVFADWTNGGAQDKDALMEKLPGNFSKLMDAVTVARSRFLIKKHYPDEDGKRLDFPAHDTIQNESPPTDIKGELSYADLHKRIGKFELSIYSPSDYLRADEEKDGAFLQSDRERFLIGMMRVNFLKRLESSSYAFRQTLARTIEKIRTTEDKIARYQKQEAIIRQQQPLADIGDAPPDNGEADTSGSIPEEADMEDAEEDEDWTVGKKKPYKFSELRLNEWLKDLAKDRKTLEGLLETAERVTPARDAKLLKLKALLRDKITSPTTNKDGGENRKALIFTSYTDTAQYLFGELKHLAAELNTAIALVVGSGNNDTTAKNCKKEYGDILRHFSPGDQKPEGEEITILIATDCVSEGQNLQDCDYVINYDIHWNPVRIVQRFGRIDRIGSKAEKIKMTNFWPNIDLNAYLKLKHRVEARMALVALGGGGTTIEGEKAEATKILEFRNKQLLDLYNKDIDADTIDADGVNISHLTMTDFLAELSAYLQKDKEKFDRAPDGLCAVVPADPKKGAHAGVIFCLRHKGTEANKDEQRKQNGLHPHYLVYVREGGRVVYSHTSAIRSLKLFGALCRGEDKAIKKLCTAFDSDITSTDGKTKYKWMLQAAVKDIVNKYKAAALSNLSADPGATLPAAAAYPSEDDDFVLTSWLVIRDK